MSMVARSFQVVPLDQAARQLTAGELPSRALAITFDDGYADNLEVAMPILRGLGLTATVFVSTGFLDGGRMWNDAVIECLRRTHLVKIDLADFGLAPAVLNGPASRRQVIEQLLPKVKYAVPSQREHMLDRLHDLCGRPDLPNNLMLTTEGVRKLKQSGLDVGAHSVNHPILSTLSEADALREMADSRAMLQAVVEAPISLFAYPNGQPGTDFDARHKAMARQLGFQAAVSTRKGVARAGDDLFELPRYTPWESGAMRWMARLVAHHALA